jgi:hypothetical protein
MPARRSRSARHALLGGVLTAFADELFGKVQAGRDVFADQRLALPYRGAA